MASSKQPTSCLACGQPQTSSKDPLIPAEYHEGEVFHLSCFNGPAARAWREAAKDSDPAYKRFMELSTMEHEVTCPGCGEVQAVSPKSVGMAAGSWNPSCTRCHRHSPGSMSWADPDPKTAATLMDRVANRLLTRDDMANLGPEVDRTRPLMKAFGELIESLEALREGYLRGRDLHLIPGRVAELAARHDPHLADAHCPCGGRYSLAAQPRCVRCREILLDSFFHDVCA